MESTWELPVPPGSFDRAQGFQDLLQRLRYMYEEVCAHNTHLELKITGAHENGLHDDLDLPQDAFAAGCQSLTLAGAAKVERPGALLTPKTPRIPSFAHLGNHTASSGNAVKLGHPVASLAGNADLLQTISNLALQQEALSEKITEVLTSREERHAKFRSRVSTLSAAYGARTSRKSRISTGTAETSLEPDEEKLSMNAFNSEARRSRFAVSSGGTANSSFFGEWAAVSKKSSMAFLRPRLRRLLNGTRFSIAILLLILSYAAFVAVETEVISQNPGTESLAITVIHYAFNLIFFCELSIRFIADGFKTFYGKDGIWNRIDAVLVISAIAEIVLEMVAATSSSADKAMGVVRIVRIARVVRTVRLLRSFREFHEFQKMAYALMSSLKTLVCSLAILIFVMFVFAVALTRSAADEDMRNQITDLELRYGNLRYTTYTLFLAVSNGISWDYAYMPLYELSWWSATAFIIYISITMFGVLNVVTSIFVESVTRSVQHYKDLIVQDKEVEKQIAISHVKEVFAHVDSDNSGEVTIDELEYFLSEPSLRKYMEALDIDAEDTRLLFRLLDRDDSRIISLEEFCEGCLRLKGNARSIDVQTLMFQNRNFLSKWSEFTGFVEDSFSKLRKMIPQELPEIPESIDSARSSLCGVDVGHVGSLQSFQSLRDEDYSPSSAATRI